MGIADVAGDWKRVSADHLSEVEVRQVDADTGPADGDTIAEAVPALQGEARDAPVPLSGGEVSARGCRFEMAVADVGFVLNQRHRITDAAGAVWAVDTVKTDASGELYLIEATQTRG